jgi:hypothetical protein
MFTAYLFVAFSFLVLLTIKLEDDPKLNVFVSAFWIITIPVICLILLLNKFRVGVDLVYSPAHMTRFGIRKATAPTFSWFAIRAFGYELQIWRKKHENL